MKHITTLLKDKKFLIKTISLTIPVALQNLLSNLLNLVDTLLIGKLGETSLGGVGLANRVFFVFSLLMFGICSGSGVLASQYYGKREIANLKRVLRICLLLGVSASLIFVIPGVLFPRFVMSIFTTNDGMITVGAAYLCIIAFSYPLTAVTNAYVSILRSMNYVRIPMLITGFAIFVNIVLNIGLIFGKFGLPELGVIGSAVATLIARILEFGLLQIIIRFHRKGDDGVGDFIHRKLSRVNSRENAFLSKTFLMKYFHTAAPVIANEFMWGLGVTMYSLVYGRMSNAATAAMTITSSIEQIVMVIFFGICHASAVILGNELGADKLDKAREHANSYMIIQFLLSIIGALITLSLRDGIISMFTVSSQVENDIRLCITVLALYMPAKALNTLMIVAILRSGGDTKAALFLDVSGVWLIGIPMAVLGGLVFKLPVYYVYAMVMIEEVYKMILGFLRFRQKKWLKNIVSEGLS